MSDAGFTAASIQPFAPADADANTLMQRCAWQTAEDAARRGARLLVLPEVFNTFGLSVEQAIERSQDTSDIRRKAAEFCRTHQAWLLLPLIEQRDGKRFNTAHLFAPAGDIALTYDKTHLTLSEREDYGLVAGDAINVVQTPLGCIGVMICYDVYFCEVARVLALQGAEIILLPSLQRSDNEESCMLLNRVRAMDSTCYLIRSSFGQKRGDVFVPGKMYGGSCIVAPDGSVLANAGRHEGVAAAEISPKLPWKRPRCGGRPPQAVREFLAEDRRPELYGRICRP